MVESCLLGQILSQNIQRSHRMRAASRQSHLLLVVVEVNALLSNQFQLSWLWLPPKRKLLVAYLQHLRHQQSLVLLFKVIWTSDNGLDSVSILFAVASKHSQYFFFLSIDDLFLNLFWKLSEGRYGGWFEFSPPIFEERKLNFADSPR